MANNPNETHERETIDMTPTWSGILDWYLTVLTDGNVEGKKAARTELGNMAKAADQYVEVAKEFKNSNMKSLSVVRNAGGFYNDVLYHTNGKVIVIDGEGLVIFNSVEDYKKQLAADTELNLHVSSIQFADLG